MSDESRTEDTPDEEKPAEEALSEETLSEETGTPDFPEIPEADEPPYPEGYKSGTVALVGRPNAGKSTLMNALLPEKLAIVSSKPQTTRNRLVGILSEDEGQMVFYDTPGVHKPHHRMNRQMIKSAQEALNEADVVCLLVDVSQSHGGGDEYMLQWLESTDAPKIALLNKIDMVKKPSLLPRMALYGDTGQFEEIVPISALKHQGLDVVRDLLWGYLPEGEPIFDPELLTVHPERFLAAEIVREKVLERTHEELPYSTAVVVDQWEEREERDDGSGGHLVVIHASILVERPGQKKILIGAGGRTIKAIGTEARHELERFLDSRVYLDLHVKLEKDWRENQRVLDRLEAAPYAVGLE